MKAKKVCIVIVTYNRKEYLVRLLQEGLLRQTYPIEKILIYDNASTDGTPEMLAENGFIDCVVDGQLTANQRGEVEFLYYRNKQNSGGAGGFAGGIELACRQNCELIWTMDDDVLPESDCLERLVSVLSEQVQLCLPCRTDERFEDTAILDIDFTKLFCRGIPIRQIYSREIEGETVVIKQMVFEGPLFTKRLVEQIGLPRKELFIFGDDSDYALRASAVTELRYVKHAILHRQIIPSGGCEKRMGWRDYYMHRNSYWMDITYGRNKAVQKIRPWYRYFIECCCEIVKGRAYNLKVLRRAYRDAVSGTMGKTVNPGEQV